MRYTYDEFESMANRKITVYKWERKEGKSHVERVFVSNGIFHQWGCDYDEFESGPGNYSTAIVEMPDGKVKNVRVELIEFVQAQKGDE